VQCEPKVGGGGKSQDGTSQGKAALESQGKNHGGGEKVSPGGREKKEAEEGQV